MFKQFWQRLWLVICIVCTSLTYASDATEGYKAKPTQEQTFLLGIGGFEQCVTEGRITVYRGDCPVAHTPVTDRLSQIAPQVNSVSIWITRDWQENWYSLDTLQTDVIDKGYTPVFLFYWFADEISPRFIEANKDAYRADLARFLAFISQLNGPKWVVLDPEFNQGEVNNYDAYNDFLIENMQAIKQVPNTLASFCLGDFGEYDLTYDKYNWASFHPSIRRAAKEADFISFQQMRAITRNPSHHITNTAERALEFARFLHQKYQKPTYFSYLALSSYGREGEAQQAHVYQRLHALLPQFKAEAQLIGFNSFHLYDVPYHVGYFNEAEAFFGLHDKDGKPKPALEAFKAFR